MITLLHSRKTAAEDIQPYPAADNLCSSSTHQGGKPTSIGQKTRPLCVSIVAVQGTYIAIAENDDKCSTEHQEINAVVDMKKIIMTPTTIADLLDEVPSLHLVAHPYAVVAHPHAVVDHRRRIHQDLAALQAAAITVRKTKQRDLLWR
jgi:hypothetical protein